MFQELSRKGISSATVREAVKTVFGHSSGGVRIDDPSAEGYASDDDCGDALQGKRQLSNQVSVNFHNVNGPWSRSHLSHLNHSHASTMQKLKYCLCS